MLREDQIVRYGRQILLRELGGKGQERLLSSPVRVLGHGPAIDDAVAWLLAGGTPVELPPGFTPSGFPPDPLNPDAKSPLPPVLELLPADLRSTARTQVVVGAGIAFRTAAACDTCWAALLDLLGPAGPMAPVGSLAALAAQRLVLGWAEPLGLVLWKDGRFEAAPIPGCTHAPKHE
ncbi:MAG: hypothetical protein Q8L48_02010 [Archangium sp.]|nr:hypothetical protein [Archangium sp.]